MAVPHAVWAAIERTCHHVDVVPVMTTHTGQAPVRAVCRCGWRGPDRPAVKAGTWAARDGEEHLADVERNLA